MQDFSARCAPAAVSTSDARWQQENASTDAPAAGADGAADDVETTVREDMDYAGEVPPGATLSGENQAGEAALPEQAPSLPEQPASLGSPANIPDDGSFEIWLVWSDRRIRVGPDQSTLDALLDADVAIEPGCQVGGCGECMTRYVEGDIIHKDNCLSETERRQHFCPCVSRAKGVLALPF